MAILNCQRQSAKHSCRKRSHSRREAGRAAGIEVELRDFTQQPPASFSSRPRCIPDCKPLDGSQVPESPWMKTAIEYVRLRSTRDSKMLACRFMHQYRVSIVVLSSVQ
jgi:hypothetical protein